MMQKDKKYIGIGEASEYLNVSIDTLRRWEKRGKIESVRSPGNHRYFAVEDLDKLFGKKYQHDVSSIKPDKPKLSEIAGVEKIIKESVPEVTVSIQENEYPSFGLNIHESYLQERISPITRPVRDVQIPELKLIRVIKEEKVTIDSNSKTDINPKKENEDTSTPTLLPDTKEVLEKVKQQEKPQLKENIKTKSKSDNLALYITILIAVVIFIGFVFFIIGVSSRDIISPIP